MESATAAMTVKVVAVLHAVVAAASAIFVLLLLFTAARVSGNDGFGDLAALASILMAGVFIIIAIIGACIAYGLWRRRIWGRVLLLVKSWLWVIVGIMGVLHMAGIYEEFMFRDNVAIVGFMILGVISIVIIWLFQFNEDVKAVFTA
jgi:hypothetical protein